MLTAICVRQLKRQNFSRLLTQFWISIYRYLTSLPGGNSEWEPPDPIPNSEVKTLSADGSVGSPHVRVGHRQALYSKGRIHLGTAFFYARVSGVVTD